MCLQGTTNNTRIASEDRLRAACRTQVGRVSVEIGRLACWRNVLGVRLVYGRHDLLTRALETGTPVAMRDDEQARIEHVTDPNRDGFALGWPVGTRRQPIEPVQVEQARRRTPTAKIRRRHGAQRDYRSRNRAN